MRDSQPSSDDQHAFRDPGTLARWTRVSLCVCAVANAVFVWLWFSAAADGTISPAAIVSVEPFLPHVYWYYPVQWITVILVLKWVYRSNYNARQLGAEEMEFTPLLAIGSYCIPVLWFWTPFLVMKEVWQASSNPAQWKNEPGSILLSLWWAFWIIAFTAWLADEVLIHMLSDVGGFMGWVGVLSPSLEIPAALLLVVIVSKVHGRQMEHYRSQAVTGHARPVPSNDRPGDR